MHLNTKQLKVLILANKEKTERLRERLLDDSMHRLLHGVTDAMESRGEKEIPTRVHDMRNRIAEIFREKYPCQYLEFFAYTLMIGSTDWGPRNKYLDFPAPSAETVLAEVVDALEKGKLKSDPVDVEAWVRQRVSPDKPRRKPRKTERKLEE